MPLEKTQQVAFPGSKPIPPPGPAFACPANAPKRNFDVTAVYGPIALPGSLVYNSRVSNGNVQEDPQALLYVLSSDLTNGCLKPGVHHEPLILRAAAGDCITVTLTNGLPTTTLNPGLPAAANPFPGIQLETSHQVGLHPQLLAYGRARKRRLQHRTEWSQDRCARPTCDLHLVRRQGPHNANGATKYEPVEFGAVDLAPADPLMQDNFGLIGALIIEPQGSTWKVDQNTKAGATGH